MEVTFLCEQNWCICCEMSAGSLSLFSCSSELLHAHIFLLKMCAALKWTLLVELNFSGLRTLLLEICWAPGAGGHGHLSHLS